jgi:hypothetical protein
MVLNGNIKRYQRTGAIRAFFGINMRKMKIQVSRMIIW